MCILKEKGNIKRMNSVKCKNTTVSGKKLMQKKNSFLPIKISLRKIYIYIFFIYKNIFFIYIKKKFDIFIFD